VNPRFLLLKANVTPEDGITVNYFKLFDCVKSFVTLELSSGHNIVLKVFWVLLIG
jgi:hypothetical protein